MDNTVDIDLVSDNGNPIDQEIGKIIAMRTRELNETTQDACVALAINILKSIRANTKLAKLSGQIDIEDVTSQYTPSWKRMGKGKNVRVLRAGKDGSEINPMKVRWLCGGYSKGEKLYTYKITDNISQDKKREYLIVTKSKGEAKKYANDIHKKYVKRYRGLAKLALGMACHAVSTRQSVGSQPTSQDAQRVAQQMTRASINSSGFNSGVVNVHVEDNLDYAQFALKGTTVDECVDKALRGMVGYLTRKLDGKNLLDNLKTATEDNAL